MPDATTFDEATHQLIAKIGSRARSCEIKYATLDGEDREPEPGEHVDWTVTAIALDGSVLTATREGAGGDRTPILLALAAVARELGLSVRLAFEEDGDG